jgi:molybdopterin-guanine dinucleotide biosynthesis protein A
MTNAGIILAGGQSKRMGSPKAWLPVGAELMLPRIVRLLSEAVSPVIVVAAPGQDLPVLPAEIQVVRDEREGRGPLQGLAAGLSALNGIADAAFVTGCDTPFLRPAFVTRMFALLDAGSICVPRIDNHCHPLAGVYRASVLSAVNEMLKTDHLKLQDLLDRVPTRMVGAPELLDIDPNLESLRNVNTAEEYKEALRDFR